jgi:NAD(P)-dependent dehydrogenase (short-subunit alcohol dehydrogenase family)
MKSVLITSASTGIGEACALYLDRAGWRVFAGVRKKYDAERLRQKASVKLTPVIMEITDEPMLAEAAKVVANLVGEAGLDGLVNNAGIVVAGPLEYLPIDELRRQLDVNVVGQVAVTQAFLPLLRKAHGRIVNIGSISGHISAPLLGPYSASKFALDAITSALRMELQPWGIHVAIIEPASIATPIWRKSLTSANKIATDYPLEALEKYRTVIDAQRRRANDADRASLPRMLVVRKIVHALSSPKPKTRYTVGTTAAFGSIIGFMPDRLREWLILRQI